MHFSPPFPIFSSTCTTLTIVSIRVSEESGPNGFPQAPEAHVLRKSRAAGSRRGSTLDICGGSALFYGSILAHMIHHHASTSGTVRIRRAESCGSARRPKCTAGQHAADRPFDVGEPWREDETVVLVGVVSLARRCPRPTGARSVSGEGKGRAGPTVQRPDSTVAVAKRCGCVPRPPE